MLLAVVTLADVRNLAGIHAQTCLFENLTHDRFFEQLAR